MSGHERRSSLTRFLRRPLLAFAILACAGLASAGLYDNGSLGQYEDKSSEMPQRFVRLDVADAGFTLAGDTKLLCGRFLRMTSEQEYLRLGFAFAEGMVDDDAGLTMMLPVYVGANIWSLPRKTWFFCGAVPEVYGEVGMSFIYGVRVKAVAGCDVDYYGVGVRVEAGVLAGSGLAVTPFVSAQVRLLTFGIGF
jgi:hypothetical protein